MSEQRTITVSVVSHRQAHLVEGLLEDLATVSPLSICLILTSNVQETLPFRESDFPFPLFRRVNDHPLGFGANHNAAFSLCETPFFCVVNPDIRIAANPFPTLTRHAKSPGNGVVAPLVKGPEGNIEDNARRFPSLKGLLKKAVKREQGLDYSIGTEPIQPDWVAGMFMLFYAETFAGVGGFDDRYFLYYEDVDLCARLRNQGKSIVLDPTVSVIHNAQRSSHRKLRYALWHGQSMIRFLLSDHSRNLPVLPFRKIEP